MAKKFEEQLKRYVPEVAVPFVMNMIEGERLAISIKRTRTSKHGDYRPPFKVDYHKISVNHDLNPYAFLITLVHEIAHLKCWNLYQNSVSAHGEEWKTCFKELMNPLLEVTIFPETILVHLIKHMRNPKASSSSDIHLLKALKTFDTNKATYLEDIPLGAVFSLNGDKFFRKGEKRRTRYECINLLNKRTYLVHALAEVELINEKFIRE